MSFDEAVAHFPENLINAYPPNVPYTCWKLVAKTDSAGWNQSIEQFRRDLLTPIPPGYGGHTLLREAMILADHNAYHVGELTILRRVMNAWSPQHRL